MKNINCKDCAGHGHIKDFSGKKMVTARPCQTCFGTGYPTWMILEILHCGELFCENERATNGAATPGTHAEADGGKSSPVHGGRSETRSGVGGDRDAQREERGDGSRADGSGTRPSDPPARDFDVRQAILDILRSINQLWMDKPK